MIRVMLVDDHQLIRSCFREVLGREPGLEIVAEAGNGEEAKRLFAEVATWNFNSVGFALVRRDARERAAA